MMCSSRPPLCIIQTSEVLLCHIFLLGSHKQRVGPGKGRTIQLPHRRLWRIEHCGRRRGVAASSQNGQGDNNASPVPRTQDANANTSSLKESDAAFLFKLFIISVTGSAAVKYGSLLFDTPFQPDLSLALLIIAAPCILFAIFLSIESRQQEDAPPL